jgi:F-type H+-transporting ATPase subunit alpha
LEVRHPEVLAALKAGKLDDASTSVLETVAKELSANYN